MIIKWFEYKSKEARCALWPQEDGDTLLLDKGVWYSNYMYKDLSKKMLHSENCILNIILSLGEQLCCDYSFETGSS